MAFLKRTDIVPNIVPNIERTADARRWQSRHQRCGAGLMGGGLKMRGYGRKRVLVDAPTTNRRPRRPTNIPKLNGSGYKPQ